MRTFSKRASARTDNALVVVLPFHQRQKSRLRVVSTAGEEVAILLPRGQSLRDGDCLEDEHGATLIVRAAEETLSRARTVDPHLLTRAAYHLGNRHVPLQIEPGCLSYQSDHVLDAMVRELGLDVGVATAPFEPEGGAYSGHDRTALSHTPAHPEGSAGSDPEDEEEPDTLRDGREDPQ